MMQFLGLTLSICIVLLLVAITACGLVWITGLTLELAQEIKKRFFNVNN